MSKVRELLNILFATLETILLRGVNKGNHPSVKYKPYFSIDLETTGLPEEGCSILELAIIYNDGSNSDPKDFPYLKLIIDNGDDIIWNDYAKKLNQRIIDDINHFRKFGSSRETRVVSLEMTRTQFEDFVHTHQTRDSLGKVERLSVAGKNAAGFDLPLLKTFGFNCSGFNHRVLDPGPMYYADFGYIPNLTEIKIKYKEHFDSTVVSHDAYDDALDVIVAINIKKNAHRG